MSSVSTSSPPLVSLLALSLIAFAPLIFTTSAHQATSACGRLRAISRYALSASVRSPRPSSSPSPTLSLFGVCLLSYEYRLCLAFCCCEIILHYFTASASAADACVKVMAHLEALCFGGLPFQLRADSLVKVQAPVFRIALLHHRTPFAQGWAQFFVHSP